MARFYYVVDAVPDVHEDGITADVPDGVSWCGNTDGTSYLVVVGEELAGRTAAFVVPERDDPQWKHNREAVAVGDRRVYEGVVYECIQAHTTQRGWEPPNTPALWTVAREQGDPWVAPTMAEDSYAIDDIVSHDGFLWRSKIDANTTEPGSDDRWWEQGEPLPDVEAELIGNGAAFAAGDPQSRWSVRSAS